MLSTACLHGTATGIETINAFRSAPHAPLYPAIPARCGAARRVVEEGAVGEERGGGQTITQREAPGPGAGAQAQNTRAPLIEKNTASKSSIQQQEQEAGQRAHRH